MSHHRSTEDMLRKVLVPDTSSHEQLSLSPSKGSMSFVAGEFGETYSSEEDLESFDVVVTVFFLDTAPNVINYLHTIHHVLRKGGKWINIGPLSWHFENTSEQDVGPTIELTLSEVIQLIQKMGFVFETSLPQRKSIKVPYMEN